MSAEAASGASATILVNGTSHSSGDNATWKSGVNTVTVTASKKGCTSTAYTVTVTKKGWAKCDFTNDLGRFQGCNDSGFGLPVLMIGGMGNGAYKDSEY